MIPHNFPPSLRSVRRTTATIKQRNLILKIVNIAVKLVKTDTVVDGSMLRKRLIYLHFLVLSDQF